MSETRCRCPGCEGPPSCRCCAMPFVDIPDDIDDDLSYPDDVTITPTFRHVGRLVCIPPDRLAALEQAESDLAAIRELADAQADESTVDAVRDLADQWRHDSAELAHAGHVTIPALRNGLDLAVEILESLIGDLDAAAESAVVEAIWECKTALRAAEGEGATGG